MKRWFLILWATLLTLIPLQRHTGANAFVLESSANVAYSMGFNNGATTFFQINLDTGKMLPINTFPEFNSLFAFVATTDVETGRYFQPAIDNDFVQRLMIVDTSTGTLISAPNLPAGISLLEYQNGSLYGLVYDFDQQRNVFMKLNPNTLEMTLLTPIPDALMGIMDGISAIDEQYFYFEAATSSGDRLYKIDLQTLEITSIPLSPSLLHFVPLEGVLIGVTTSTPLNHLVKVDLATGETEILSEITGLSGLYQASSLYDAEKGLYLFPVIDADFKHRLLVYEIQSGELVANPELTLSEMTANFGFLNHQALTFSGQLQSFERGRVRFRVYLPYVIRP